MAAGKKTGGGSRKGKPNKFTAELDAMIDGALHSVGGEEYLARQAEENPGAFMALLGKRLVKTVKVGGDPDHPIKHHHASDPRTIQTVNDLIRAIAGARQGTGDASVSAHGPLLSPEIRDGQG